jgi:hypothetical protein
MPIYIAVCIILSALGIFVFGKTPVLIIERINTRVHTNILGRYFVMNKRD